MPRPEPVACGYKTDFWAGHFAFPAKRGYSMEWSDKKSTGEILTNKLRIALMFTQEGRCHVCRIEEWRLKRKLQAHRVIPGKFGGKYVFENVVLVCNKCHRKIEGLSREEINRLRGAK